MLYAGLDLSRKRLDYHLLDEAGETIERGASPPDADGLRTLAERLGRHRQPLRAAIESMTGARFVHDRLEHLGWEVKIADALKVKGLAPLACKTDRIDAWVLAELCRRQLVPAIWLPTRPSAPSASEPASASTSSATAPASNSASTRSYSPTASPARSRISSVPPAGRCWPTWRCRSPGQARSPPACA
jgi:hypothetical protein